MKLPVALALLAACAAPPPPKHVATTPAPHTEAAERTAVLADRAHLADAPLVDLIKDMATNVGKEAFLRQQQAIMERPDSRDTLWKIRCPTLVLCGEDDQLTPPNRHEEIAAAIRGSKLVVIPGCGHLSTVEKPLEVNRALSAWLVMTSQAG